jgi:hypothetical protein
MTTTRSALSLDPAEAEALRDGTFWAMETYDYDPTQPADPDKIPAVIHATVQMTNYFLFFVEALRAAQEARVAPRLLNGDRCTLLYALMDAWRVQLEGRVEELREEPFDDPARLEPQLLGCRALVERLRMVADFAEVTA